MGKIREKRTARVLTQGRSAQVRLAVMVILVFGISLAACDQGTAKMSEAPNADAPMYSVSSSLRIGNEETSISISSTGNIIILPQLTPRDTLTLIDRKSGKLFTAKMPGRNIQSAVFISNSSDFILYSYSDNDTSLEFHKCSSIDFKCKTIFSSNNMVIDSVSSDLDYLYITSLVLPPDQVANFDRRSVALRLSADSRSHLHNIHRVGLDSLVENIVLSNAAIGSKVFTVKEGVVFSGVLKSGTQGANGSPIAAENLDDTPFARVGFPVVCDLSASCRYLFPSFESGGGKPEVVIAADGHSMVSTVVDRTSSESLFAGKSYTVRTYNLKDGTSEALDLDKVAPNTAYAYRQAEQAFYVLTTQRQFEALRNGEGIVSVDPDAAAQWLVVKLTKNSRESIDGHGLSKIDVKINIEM